LRSLKDRWLLARQLSARDWLTLVEAWWVLLGFYLASRHMSFERLENPNRLAPEKAADSLNALVFAGQLQKLVEIASRLHLLSMTCLIQALTLHWMLNRRGIPSRLCIGARKNSTGIGAHAWVEIQGHAIGQDEAINENFNVLKSPV